MIGEYLVNYNDNTYVVVRVVKESSLPILASWKQRYDCDTVLKKDGYYYFCRLVKEAEVIDNDVQSETEV